MISKTVRINTKLITKAVAELCKKANIMMTDDTYQALSRAYENESSSKAKNVLAQILKNARLAAFLERPLCQDTGLVVVFAEIGQNVHLVGSSFEDAVNQGVSNCYIRNYFRKSVVKKPLFTRINTESNTPAVIHTKIVPGNSIKLSVSIKGAGSENMSAVKMFKPSADSSEIVDFVVKTVKQAGANPCPPIRLGIGIGGSFEQAAILAKKALLEPIKSEEYLKKRAEKDKIAELQCEIFKKVNELGIGAAGMGGNNTIYGVNILTSSTHIAALPVAVNINCHSSRHAEAIITENDINYNYEPFKYDFLNDLPVDSSVRTISLDDISAIKKLKAGDEVLLSGIIYTARDAAHKELINCINSNQELPFDIKNKIIFYVGPCPAMKGEIIGPSGPTTASRMDRFAPVLYDLGMLGSIGKGERSPEVVESIKKNQGVYFITSGGIAVLLSQKIKKAEIIAFPGLGPEAIYRLEVENFPVVVGIDSKGNCI